MAHFAKLNDDNEVIEINVVSNDELDPLNEEQSGITFLTQWSNGHTHWKKTSYNAATNGFRYNYAGIGYKYDEVADAFIAPKPECGHTELQLNDQYRWECSNAEHEALA